MKKKHIFGVGFLSLFTAISLFNVKGNPFKVNAELKEGEQGYQNWYFLYGDAAGTYYKMDYELTTGTWKYGATEPYCCLKNDSSHPGRSGDAIRAYRAPYDGTLSLSAYFEHGSPDGDGVKVSIGRRNINTDGSYSDYVLLQQDGALKTASVTLTITNVEMKLGDMFYISVNKRETDTNDSTSLIPNVTPVKTGDGINYGDWIGDAHKINCESFYSLEQGKVGWFYTFGDIGKYVPMTYGNCNDGTRTWHGIFPYQQIGPSYMHPADRWKTIRVWVADYDGTINIEGAIRHQQIYGDGVRVGIALNNESIFDLTIEGSDDKNHNLPESLKNINVHIGDNVAVWIDSGERLNNTNDATDFNIELYYVNKTGEKTDKDLTSFINLLSCEGDLIDYVHTDREFAPDNSEFVKLGKKGCAGSVISTSIIISTVSVVLVALLLIKNKKKHTKIPLFSILLCSLFVTSCAKNEAKNLKNKIFDNISDFADSQGYNNWHYYCGDIDQELQEMTFNIYDAKWKDHTGIGYIQKDLWYPSTDGEIMAAFIAPAKGKLDVKIDLKLVSLQEIGSDGVAFYCTTNKTDEYFFTQTLKNQKLTANGSFEQMVEKDEIIYFALSGITSSGNDFTSVHIQINYK